MQPESMEVKDFDNASEPSLAVKDAKVGRKKTIASEIRDNNGKTFGFDYLRLILAISVIVVHAFTTTYGGEVGNFVYEGYFRPITTFILPAFFALSGFLVSGSLARNPNLVNFLTLRAIRIVPALSFETVLCALILGPLVTSLSLSAYFSDAEFFRYLLNSIGIIHFFLPGVFLDNPFPRIVNGQLWTVPIELECYVAISLLFICRIFNSKKLLVLTVVAYIAYAFVKDMFISKIGYDSANVPQKVLLIGFLCGVLFYMLQEHIRYSRFLFAGSVMASYLLLYFPQASYFSVFPITYIIVYIGIMNVKKKTFLLRGDYSYGIYLFGFPTQQTLMHFAGDSMTWWLNILICVPLSILCAAVSWHLLEKPILTQKRHIVDAVQSVVRKILRRKDRLPRRA